MSRSHKRKKTRKAGGAKGDGPKLSLCMIVKNEEKLLEGCLESVRNLVDEIVVVDTGSTDGTRRILERFGAKIIPFEWVNDFAAARNESLRHATGEWILYLDADERLASGQEACVRALVSNHNVAAYSVLVGGEHQLSTGIVRQVNAYPRLFRRHPAIRFEGKVHEQITPSLQRYGRPVVHTDIFIEHLGYAHNIETIQKKCRRNIDLLQEQLKQDPDDAYVHFQIGNTYAVLQDYQSAEEHLYQALFCPSLSSTIRPSIFNLLAEICITRNQLSEATNWCLESIRISRHQLMARWFLSAIFMAMKNFGDAIVNLKEILVLQDGDIQQRTASIAFDLFLDRADVLHRLGVCYEGIGASREAAEAFLQVVNEKPGSGDALRGLLRAQESSADPFTAIAQLEGLLARNPQWVEVTIPLARNYWKTKNSAKAYSLLKHSRACDPQNAETFALEVRWRMEEGDYVGAATVLDVAEERGMEGWDLSKCAVQLALQRGDIQQAFTHLRRFIDRTQVNTPEIQERLTALSSRLGNH